MKEKLEIFGIYTIGVVVLLIVVLGTLAMADHSINLYHANKAKGEIVKSYGFKNCFDASISDNKLTCIEVKKTISGKPYQVYYHFRNVGLEHTYYTTETVADRRDLN